MERAMRKVLMGSIVAAAIAAIGTTAKAGTYIPVPMVEGAVSQIVFSINNHNVVAGSFRDSANVEHGFFGPLDGSNYTVFDFPGEGTIGTQARSINDHGAITGIALNPKFKVGEQFYRSPNGKFKTFRANGKKLDGIAQGLDDGGISVGDYTKPNGKIVGYLGQKGRYLKDFLAGLQGSTQISPRGIVQTVTSKFVVGFHLNISGGKFGFIYEKTSGQDAHTQVIGHSNASGTALEDINKSLVASGQWTDSEGNSHGFTYRLHNGNYVDLDPLDGSTSQQAWGINDHNLVALSTSSGISYIYCPRIADKCPAGGFPRHERSSRLRPTGVTATQ